MAGRDLLMLKFNAGSTTNRLIAFGQRVRGQVNSMVVHAGIMFDPTYIIESSGQGLVANDIRVQNAAYGRRCGNVREDDVR